MTMLEQFIAAFNDIVIKRYDKDHNEILSSDTKVSFVYAPKQRVFETLNTPGPGAPTVPAIAVSIASITRDKSRVFNKNEGFMIPFNTPEVPEIFLKKIPQPLPVNIAVNMTIIAKYQEDMDQIISNIIPYNDPYVVISWKFPGLKESDTPFEIRSEVTWSGTITPTYPQELAAGAPFKLSADTSFTIKGWIFKKFDEPYKKIYYINTDFTALGDIREGDRLLKTLETDTRSISAIPHPKVVYPSCLYYNDALIPTLPVSAVFLDVYGKYLFQPRNVYLSASDPSMFDNIQTWDLFSAYPKLSSFNPPFNAVRLSSFNPITDEHLQFSLPQIPLNFGYIDIIVENEAGYGKLSTCSLRPAISSWSGWVYEPSPVVNGIPINYLGISILTEDNANIVDEFGNTLVWN